MTNLQGHPVPPRVQRHEVPDGGDEMSGGEDVVLQDEVVGGGLPGVRVPEQEREVQHLKPNRNIYKNEKKLKMFIFKHKGVFI